MLITTSYAINIHSKLHTSHQNKTVNPWQHGCCIFPSVQLIAGLFPAWRWRKHCL